jgi:hypothetical protein
MIVLNKYARAVYGDSQTEYKSQCICRLDLYCTSPIDVAPGEQNEDENRRGDRSVVEVRVHSFDVTLVARGDSIYSLT